MLNELYQLVNRYLTFVVGTSQVILTSESAMYWIFIQVWGDLQLMGLLFIHNLGGIVKGQQLVVYFSLPTLLLMDFIDSHIIPLALLILLMFIMHLINIRMIFNQIQEYQIQKQSNKNTSTDPISRKIHKLTQIYGQNDYSNFWFELVNQAYTTDLLLTKAVTHYFNVFAVVFNKPIQLYAFHNVINGQTTVEFILGIVLIILAGLNYAFVYNFFRLAMTVNSVNFLRLKTSIFYLIEQLMEHAIIVVVVLDIPSQQTIIAMISVAFALKLIELFYAIPFVEGFKRITIILTSTSGLLLISTATESGLGGQSQMIFMISPLIVRLMTSISYSQLIDLVEDYFFEEKELSDMEMNLNNQGIMGAYIRQIIAKMRQKFVMSLQNKEFIYFPQLLKLVLSANLHDAQVFIVQNKQQKKVSPLTSKLLFYTGILFNKHSNKCQNIYCFCKGFRGEQVQCTQESINIKNLCVNSDLSILSVNFYADLIHRYIRNYCKTVFIKYKDKPQLDITYLIQLIAYLADSDECIQSVLSALELVNRLGSVTQSLTIFESISIGVAVQFIKFSILIRYNGSVNSDQMDATFQYEEFRSVQKKSIKMFNMFTQCIQAKQAFFKILDFQQHYTGMEAHIINLANINQEAQKHLTTFLSRTQSKTALLCKLFYEFEILNNYVNTEKIIAQIKSQEPKFFEFPDIFYDIEQLSVEVCYVKADLNYSSSGDSYNGIASRGWIRDYSRNTPKYFDYTPADFAKLRNVRELVPPSTSLIHDDLIELFLLTTRPNVIRARIPLFIKTQKGELVHTEFFADFDFKLPSGQFTIHIFLKKIKSKANTGDLKNYFWVDQFGNLEAVTSNVVESFQVIDADLYWMYNQKFESIMPQFPQIKSELDQQLAAHLAQEELLKGTVTQKHSRTFDSLQIIHSIKLPQTQLIFPSQVSIQQVDQCYRVDCEVYLKYAQLIGRIYKVYLIQINSYQLELFEGTLHGSAAYKDYQLDIPREVDGDDKPYLNIFNREISIESPGFNQMSPMRSFSSNGSKQSNVQIEQVIIQQINSHQLRNLYSDNYGIDKNQELVSSMRQNISLSMKQQVYFSEHLINNKSQTVNRSVSLAVEQDVLIRQSNNQVDQRMLHENQSQDSQSTSRGQFRIISKSAIYVEFAESKSQPPALLGVTLLNSVVLITLLILIIVSVAILSKLTTSFNTQLVLLRSTLTSDYTSTISQYLWQSELTSMNRTYDNIALITSRLGDKLSNQNITYYDLLDNSTKSINGWTFFFNLKLYYSQLNQSDKYQENIQFFLENFNYYQKWIQLINHSVYQVIDDNILLLYSTSAICILSIVIVQMFYVILLTFCIYQYIQLVFKILRCCQQITYHALLVDLQYYDELLTFLVQKKDIDKCQFNIYEHRCDYQDKLNGLVHSEKQNTKVSDSTQKKYKLILSISQQNNRKNIQIREQWNFKTYLAVPINLLSSTVFLISYVSIMVSLLSFQSTLDQGLKSFNSINVLQEEFSHIIFSNSVINLNLDSVLDDSQQNIYGLVLTQSWDEYHKQLNVLLTENSELSVKFTIALNEQLCVVNCAINISLQTALTQILKSITESGFQGYQYSQVEIQLINQIQDKLNQLLQEYDDELKQFAQDQYNQTLNLLVLFGGFILIIQLLQTILTHRYLITRFQKVKKLVYMMPTVTLYVEESFFKTLHYISFIEAQLV